MKLVQTSLSPHMSIPDGQAQQLGQAFGLAAQALQRISDILLGKSPQGFAPVAPPQLLAPAAPDWFTVAELVNEFLFSKARAGCSDRYLRQLHVSLKSFLKGRSKLPLREVNVFHFEKWIEDQDWAPRTARGYLGDVRTMFNAAVKRGYLPRNPALGVELPRSNDQGEIHIHTPDQVRQVLETARRADLDVCRLMAIRYFTGIRSAEAQRLREGEIKLDQDLIEVPAAKSKTRSRRLVTIQPNLRAWLDLGGELRPMSPDKTVRRVLKLSKVEWAHNVTRHSFVSYHMAKFQNAAKTAIEAGHAEAIMFKHYRALVTPAQAEEFWSIMPK